MSHPYKEVPMRSHALLVLCDVCGRTMPDEAAKEVVFQVDRVRYRLEMCSSCLDREMGRRDERRWIPGFRKRTALTFVLESVDDLPRRPVPAGRPTLEGAAG